MKTVSVILILVCAFAVAAADDNVINVGAVLPLSGHTSNFGTEALRGINLAVEQINAAGGIKGKTIHLTVRDNAGLPTQTAQAVWEVIDEHDVLAVIGPITSTNSAAAAAVAQEAKTPLVLPGATSPFVTEIGDNICRICFTGPFQSKALAEFSRTHLRAERVAILYEKGSDYSENLAEFYRSRLEDMGGTVTSMQAFAHGTPEFEEHVSTALKDNPDLLFAPVYYPEAVAILEEMAQQSSTTAVLGGDGWESAELLLLAGKNLQSRQVYMSSHYSYSSSSEHVVDFRREFHKTYGTQPDAVSALGYDATMVLSDAIQRATQVSKAGIRQALTTTDNYKGITGTISINEKRNVVKDVHILRVRPDSFEHETTISPF